MDNQFTGYATKGIPYYVRMYGGKKQTLIALTENDYRMLLMKGFKDEEVYLSLRREGKTTEDYDLEVRASLNTVKMDGDPLFQLRLDVEPTAELQDRGFTEGREIDIYIQMSPYRIPSQQLKPEDVDVHVFDDDNPMLDDKALWS